MMKNVIKKLTKINIGNVGKAGCARDLSYTTGLGSVFEFVRMVLIACLYT